MAVHTQIRVKLMLGKPRGIEGMTWKFKAERAAFAVVIVGGLAVASGAGFWDFMCSFLWGLF
jgi:hypothetical protein